MDLEIKSDVTFNGGLIAMNKQEMSVVSENIWEIECVRDGKIIWTEKFTNRVVTAGLNKLLDATFKTGLAAPAWYVGLKDSAAGDVAGDTMASHAGWTESSAYTQATRPAFTPGTIAAGSVDNSASKAVFNINGTTTIYGCFLADDNTKGGAVGTLYGVGDFAASRAVINGDILNVTVTLTQATA